MNTLLVPWTSYYKSPVYKPIILRLFTQLAFSKFIKKLVPKSYPVVLCGGIWERNKRCRPRIQSDNTIRYEFGTSRSMNFGNANSTYKPLYRPPSNVSPSLRKIHITVTQPKTFKQCVFRCYKVLQRHFTIYKTLECWPSLCP